jgi:hypothetical protein
MGAVTRLLLRRRIGRRRHGGGSGSDVTFNATGFTARRIALYKMYVGSGVANSWKDYRQTLNGSAAAGTSSGIADAPTGDGIVYGRKNGAWVGVDLATINNQGGASYILAAADRGRDRAHDQRQHQHRHHPGGRHRCLCDRHGD